MKDVFVRVSVPTLVATSGTYAGWTQSFGHALIEYAELKINGITIDKKYGMYMDIIDELTLTEEHRSTQNLLIGRVESLTLLETNATTTKDFYIRIPFPFSKDIERSLPLILLQRSDIDIEIQLRPFDQVVVYDGATPPEQVRIIDAELHVEMYSASEEFRKQMVREAKERDNETVILFEQVQYAGEISIGAGQQSVKTELAFNNPLKEILVVVVEDASKENNDWFNYARRSTGDKPIENVRLLLENEDRFRPELSEHHFRLISSLTHHTRSTNRFIYSLPLCEKPEEYQPSGVMNASRFDDISLLLTMRHGNQASGLHVFGLTYNLFVILNGAAALGWRD